MVEGVKEVNEGIWRHFKMDFFEPDSNKPTLEDVSLKVLSLEQSRMLESPFSDLEIKVAVWDCEVSKSLGLDGYNFYFIRKCWYFIKVNIINFVKDFHGHPKLNKAVTSSFLTLILKNSNPQGLSELDLFIL